MTADALSLFYHGYLDEAAAAYAEGRKDDALIAAARARLARSHMYRAAAQIWPVRSTVPAVPTIKLKFNPRATLRGVQSPVAAFEQREEEPFPLCRVARLPGVPRTPMPRPGPQSDPDSLFTRALAWTLKSRRA